MSFTDTLYRHISNARDGTMQIILRAVTRPLFDRQSSLMVSSAGLVIKGAGNTLAKTGAAASKYFADGVYGSIAAATDMPALVGTVTNTKFNVFCFFVDRAGTITSAMGTEGATRSAVVFPQFTALKALIGFIEINPTGTGNFVGGTTALDDATVVPNAFFNSALSGFDPACIVGSNA
jgi:hypothetical protein